MRGQIRNHAKARQQKDYSGLCFGKITPTDLDGFMEFGDHVFIFIELKGPGGEMPYGQRLAFERLVDAITSDTRASYLLLSRHEERDLDKDVVVADLMVERCYHAHRWTAPTQKITMRQAIERILKKHTAVGQRQPSRSKNKT